MTGAQAAGAALLAAVLSSAAATAAPPLPASATADFAAGRAALARSTEWSQASRQAILAAAQARRRLLSRGGAPAGAGETADAAADLERLQRDGAELRARSETARADALRHFAAGLTAGWPDWVADTEPLTMDHGLRSLMEQIAAHNVRVRSVHPNMPPPTIDAPASAPEDGGLSLHFPMLASQNPPADLDIGSFQLSRQQRVVAHVEVEPAAGTPAGNVAAVPLNRLHRWRLLLSDLQGAPVAGAAIDVGGHMPGHVHGLPTQPRVTREMAPGVYLVEGLKFQMEGWWVMQFSIRPREAAADAEADHVAFNLVF